MKMLHDSVDDGATFNTDVVSFRVSPQHPHFSSSHTLKSSPATTLALQDSPSPEDTEYEVTVDWVSGLKPFTIKLQGTVMPNPFTRPPPPSPKTPSLEDTPPRVKVPSVATRRAACTHLTVDRLYGDYTCNVCLRLPSFGWVYCCTQDEIPDSQFTPDSISERSTPFHQYTNGDQNETNGVNEMSTPPPSANGESKLGGEGVLMPTAQLSPWIEKAVEDGNYTPEQIVKLRAQKQHVVETATAAIHQFEESQTNNPNSSPQTSTTLPALSTPPYLPFPVIKSVQEPSATTLPSAKTALAWQPKSELFPFCKFCACHACRPNHRDRSWQRFEDVFEADHEIPFIHYQDRNRPLASPSLVSKIGLRPPRIPVRPPLRSNDSRALYSRKEAGQIFFINNSNNNNDSSSSHSTSADPTTSSADIANATTSAAEEASKGFRDSMKRAFKSMLATRHPGPRPGTKHRKAVDGTDGTESDPVEFDMGLWKEMNDELLREAAGVPLPGKDGVEGLGGDVAALNVGGVAVTEEAADLGTADVILSV